MLSFVLMQCVATYSYLFNLKNSNIISWPTTQELCFYTKNEKLNSYNYVEQLNLQLASYIKWFQIF